MSEETNCELVDMAIERLEEVDMDLLNENHKNAYLQAHGTLMALSVELEEDE